MATITLNGSCINFGIGINAFTCLDTSFSSAKKKTNGLQKAITDLVSKIDIASSAAKVETSQNEAQAAKKREEDKESTLTLAYDKLDELIADVGTVDNKVSTRVSDEKNDFYKTYEWLKPECEKSFGEKACEFLVKIGKGLVEWCKQVFSNVISALTAIVIIVAAVVVCIVCAPEIILAIAIIVCAVSALYTLFDVGWMLTHKGDDFATWLEKNGHPNWGAFVRGCDFGLTIASLILPVGASIKTSMTLGGKTFVGASKAWVKDSIKGFGKSLKGIGKSIKNIFTCSGKPGVKGVLQSMGKSAFKAFKSFTGIDDILRLKELRNFKNCKPGFLINYNEKYWNLDNDNMCLRPNANSKEANDVINGANRAYQKAGSNKVIDSIPLKNNHGYIDVDWDELGIANLGKENGFNFKNLDYSKSDLRGEIYINKSSRVNTSLNPGIEIKDPNFTVYTGKNGLYSHNGFTAHENWNLTMENIVPSIIHNPGKGISNHFGGVGRLTGYYNSIPVFDRTTIRNFFTQFGEEAAKTAAGGN